MISSTRARAFLCAKNLVGQLKYQLSSYESSENTVARMTSRIKELCHGLNMDYVNPSTVVQKVVSGLAPNMKSSELNRLAAEICATLTTFHPDYAALAGRIAVSTLHSHTKESFS
ncbi:Ribonucleoside-diphosphate reductase large subunit, partial [Araneus ventricosus]